MNHHSRMLKFIRKLAEVKNKQEAAQLKQSMQVDLSVIFLKASCIFNILTE